MEYDGFSEEVRTLDLEPIAFKVALDERWPLEEVDAVEFQYRCFLQARLSFPKISLAPSRAIDIFWHHHILDTLKYQEDCQKLFGTFLHHFPYSGARGEADKLEQEKRFKRSSEIIESIAKGENDAIRKARVRSTEESKTRGAPYAK